MEIWEAELIFEAGKEVVVTTLADMHTRIISLSQQVSIQEKKKSRRSAGGQKGHKGHKRELLPVEEMEDKTFFISIHLRAQSALLLWTRSPVKRRLILSDTRLSSSRRSNR